jgi:hypothetical protein
MSENSAAMRILAAQAASRAQIDSLKADENPSVDMVYARIRSYLLLRFLLEPETDGDDILELAALSVARTSGQGREGAAPADVSANCSGASSALSKKVLLLMALERDIGLDFSPEESVMIRTVRDLAESIHARMGGG